MTDPVTFTCANCGKRPGTVAWVGEGGYLAFSHGMSQMWCELCAVEADIEYVLKQLERLPGLQDRREQLDNDNA